MFAGLSPAPAPGGSPAHIPGVCREGWPVPKQKQSRAIHALMSYRTRTPSGSQKPRQRNERPAYIPGVCRAFAGHGCRREPGKHYRVVVVVVVVVAAVAIEVDRGLGTPGRAPGANLAEAP